MQGFTNSRGQFLEKIELSHQAKTSLRELSDLRSKLIIVLASKSHHSNATQDLPPCQLNLPVGLLQTADTSLHMSELGSPGQDIIRPDTLYQSISYLNISSLPAKLLISYTAAHHFSVTA
jgi:hypothetical protein